MQAIKQLHHSALREPRNLFVYCFLGISGWSSYSGLTTYLSSWGDDWNNALGGVMSIAVLQILIFYTADLYSKEGRKPVLMAFFGLVFVSSTLAINFWLDTLKLDQVHAQESLGQVQRDVSAGLLKQQEHLSRIEHLSRQLSEQADHLAQQEYRQGNTCDIKTLPGDGPVRQYRQTTARRLSLYEAHFSRQKTRYGALIQRLYGIQPDLPFGERIVKYNRLIDQANSILEDPEMHSFGAYLVERQIQQTEGVVLKYDRVRCKLIGLTDRIRTLQNIQFQRLAYPDIVDPEQKGGTLEMAFRISSRFYTLQWSKLSNAQIAVVIVGLIIDIAMFGLMLSIARDRKVVCRREDETAQDWTPELANEGKEPLPDWLVDLLDCGIRNKDFLHLYLAPAEWDLRTPRLISAIEHKKLGSYHGRKLRWLVPAAARRRYARKIYFLEFYRIRMQVINELISEYSRSKEKPVEQ